MAAAAITPRSLETFLRPASLPGVSFMRILLMCADGMNAVEQTIVNHAGGRDVIGITGELRRILAFPGAPGIARLSGPVLDFQPAHATNSSFDVGEESQLGCQRVFVWLKRLYLSGSGSMPNFWS